ncbi:MAG: cobalamin-dependent protein [Bacteroidales bacterium]|nr:cobalamin-dependent protein [Bacteroidales bacterium]MCF8343215.1 cobalamin-dependent protein [Bacteroidales bacterium]MCF8351334.1 cobalamin-dependent protein [Bacteroidales bacterium]MCF8376882.1 cobalamin-dependent protein [Bacteroidales bacterium]MCF8401513.1 cobalamin-dependent protein [Bacteroidales bacterium]
MITDQLYNKYFEALLDGDRQAVVATVNHLIDQEVGIRQIYKDLFQRALYQVGELWEHNKLSVATEHLATSLVERQMSMVYPYMFSTERKGRRAVVTCLANEYHQVGARMVADIFEMNGWDGYFLGANTPQSEVLSMISERKPDIIALSVSVSFNFSVMKEMVDLIRENFPSQSIIVGGQAFRWGGQNLIKNMDEVKLILSLEELESFIGNYN